MLSLACSLSHKHYPCFVPLQSVPWKMRPMRMEQRPRWSATAASVPVGTGCALQWRVRVRMLSRKLLVLGLDKRNSQSLSFWRHQLSRVLLFPAFPQLLCGWFLHSPHMFHVSQTQAGSRGQKVCNWTQGSAAGTYSLDLVSWRVSTKSFRPELLCIQLVQTKKVTDGYCMCRYEQVSFPVYVCISSLYLCLWNL